MHHPTCRVDDELITELMQDNDLTILCAYRKEVSQYNEAALLAKLNMPLIHAAHPAGSAAKCPELSQWLNDPQANPLPLVAVNAKVMVLSNTNFAASVANGSSGTVDSLKYDRHGKLVTIVVIMTDSGRLQRVTRSQSSSRNAAKAATRAGATRPTRPYSQHLSHCMHITCAMGVVHAHCINQTYSSSSESQTQT